MRDRPDVSVGSSATRFRVQDVLVRGAGGSRVQLRVDGARDCSAAAALAANNVVLDRFSTPGHAPVAFDPH